MTSTARPERLEAHGDCAPRSPNGGRANRRQAVIEAIVAATTRLAEDREFDELSVLDICIEADVSISSFYHRFASKDALLREVHGRYLHDVRTEISERAAEVDWAADDQTLVATLVSEYVDTRFQFARRFRTMALAEQRHPELANARQWEDHIALDALAELFASRFDDPIAAAEAKERLMFVARVIIVVAQDLTAMGRSFRSAPGDAAGVGDRLIEMTLAYMRLSD